MGTIVRHVKRRNRLFIMNKILERTKEPATKNDIMYDVRLSFSQTKEYIELLMGLGFLDQVNRNDQTAYRTTKKGFVYIKSFNEIRSLLGKRGTKVQSQ